ncbi:MAG TPA: hypothetical protein VIM07_06510 [Chitinophagaceae bacterium]
MDDVKNKMYDYETPPPDGVWESIVAELDTNKARIIPMGKKKNKIFYFAAAAASVAIIVFCVIFFTNRSSKSNEQFTSSNKTKNDSGAKNNVIITVPTEERVTVKKNTEVKHKVQKEVSDQNKNEETKNTDNVDKDAIASNTSTYITVEGPQGQPVKINSKMATLIDSSETKTSSKPIWNKKINEWREIMKANTLAPTPGNFLDIIELTKSVKDHK